MARQKYGEYTLDLRGLGDIEFTSGGDEISIEDLITPEQKQLLFTNSYTTKQLCVILPNIDFDNGQLQIIGFGNKKVLSNERTKSYYIIMDKVMLDENDVPCRVQLILTSENLVIYVDVVGGE